MSHWVKLELIIDSINEKKILDEKLKQLIDLFLVIQTADAALDSSYS